MRRSVKLRHSFPALVIVISAVFASSASALEPHLLFQKVSPSVVTVVATRDPNSKQFMSGSGVVIEPGIVITNCHVLQNSKVVVVKTGQHIHPATLQFPDVERDLCQLSVPGLQAPAIELGSTATLLVGQRVYAIGNPRQLELTLSDGLISSLRNVKDGAPLIQTTAPISPGSSGGGLFDTEGRLIGITTFQRKDSQNLNFALPVDWIRDVPERGKQSLARFAANKAAGGSGVTAPAPTQPPANPAISSQPPVQSPEWTNRIELLEKSRGKLTLTQAVAVLLDITSADEMRALLGHEQNVKRKGWHNAYAMGVDQKGKLIWGGGYQFRNANDAAETAQEYCKPDSSKSCTVVIVNGDFRESAFLALARQLGNLDVAASRQAFLASLLKPPTEARAGLASVAGGGTSDFHYAYGYSSIRE